MVEDGVSREMALRKILRERAIYRVNGSLSLIRKKEEEVVEGRQRRREKKKRWGPCVHVVVVGRR